MNLTEDEFWARIVALKGVTVHTLTQRQPNQVLSVTDNDITITGRATRPTRKNLYELYRMLGSGQPVLRDQIQDLIDQRVSRICLALVVQAVPEEVEVVRVDRKTGIRRRPPKR